MVLWGDEALAVDHIGFYSKNKLINEAPTSGHFHEEYPHMGQAWIYDDQYLNADFNYNDEEANYQAKQNALQADPAALKRDLDQQHMQ